MALPQQLKTARLSNATAVSSIDNVIGELEQAVADILGVPVNTDITEAVGGGRAKYAQITDSAAIANTTVETAFNKTYTIPANSLAVGNVVKVRAFGKYSSNSLSSLTLRIRLAGSWMFSVVNGAAQTGTDMAWYAEAIGIIRAIGASGSIENGVGLGYTFATAFGAAGVGIPGFTFDTTVNKVIDLVAQWGVASAGNTITMLGLTVEIIPASSTS